MGCKINKNGFGWADVLVRRDVTCVAGAGTVGGFASVEPEGELVFSNGPVQSSLGAFMRLPGSEDSIFKYHIQSLNCMATNEEDAVA